MISVDNVKTMYDLIHEAGKEHGNKIFMRYEKNDEIHEKTYNDIVSDSDAISNWMDEKNENAGKKMNAALIGRFSYRYIATMFGVTATGSAVVPLDIQLSKEGFIDQLDRADIEVLFYDWEFHSQVEVIREKCGKIRHFVCIQNMKKTKEENVESVYKILGDYAGKTFESKAKVDELAIIIYTSGTTGRGKGVMLSHGNLIDNVFCSEDKDEMNGAIYLNMLPIHHVFCISGDILLVIRYGSTLCLCPDIAKIMDYLKLFKPTSMRLVPMVAKMLLNRVVMYSKQNDISLTEAKDIVLGKQLRKLVSGGGYLAPDLTRKLREIGIVTGQGYGMSECSPKISVPVYERDDKLESVGKIVDGCEVRVVDGELQVKSPSVMMGYYNEPELTKEAITEDGWLRTGDLGYVDEENFIYLTGRKKNLIILSNGENVSPEMIENKFDNDLLISDILTYGQGPVIVAEIYPNYEYAQVHGIEGIEEELGKVVAERNKELPTYARIAKFNVRKIPFAKTSSKKIIRDKFFEQKKNEELRQEQLLKPQTERQKVLYQIVSDIIGHTSFGIDSNLYECGLDSLGSMMLIEEVHNRLKQTITLNDLLEYNSIIEFERLIDEAAKKQGEIDLSRRDVYPLTTMQKYFAYIIRGNTTGNLPFALKLDNGVDLEKLKSAILDTIDAHPAMKASIHCENNMYLEQFRRDDFVYEIPIIKMNDEECLQKIKESLVPFTYKKGDNLCHIALYETEKAKYMFFDVSHIMGDGVSMGILMEDINKRYAGEAIEAEDENYTFFEYILEEQNREKSGIRARDIERISNQMKGIKLQRSILTKAESQDLSAGIYNSVRRRFDKIVKKKLMYFCKNNGVTENVIFLSAFNYCISLYSNEDDVFGNSIHSGRTDSRWTRLVGPLFQTYYFRYTKTPHERVIDLLKKTGNQIMNVMKCLTSAPRQGEMFIQYQGDLLETPKIGGMDTERLSQQLDSLPFHMMVYSDAKGYHTEVRYWENRFDRELIENFLTSMEYVINAMLEERSVRRLKSYIPENLFPKHFKITGALLKQSAGGSIAPDLKDDEEVKVYVLDDRYVKKPYGAWGNLYIMDHQPIFGKNAIENPYGDGTLYQTDYVARIMPDGTVDFLERSGRIVLTDGIRGRKYYDLGKLEDVLLECPAITEAEAYMKYDETKNEMSLCADVRVSYRTAAQIDVEQLKLYIKERCGELLVPDFINV